jgi:hypothetical protein
MHPLNLPGGNTQAAAQQGRIGDQKIIEGHHWESSPSPESAKTIIDQWGHCSMESFFLVVDSNYGDSLLN